MARFSVTACHAQMKGKAYNKFSLPPNKKATAGKARALRLRGGARNLPRRPQKSPSKTNQSLSQPVLHWQGTVHAHGNQSRQPVGLRPSALRLTLFIRCTKMQPAGPSLAQCPGPSSPYSLHSAEKPTPNLGGGNRGDW